MKFGQLIEYNVKNFFLLKWKKKWGKETSSRLLLIFLKKALYKVKASNQCLSINIFGWSSTWTYNKSKLYKISYCWCRDMLNFDFLDKDVGLVSPTHFGYGRSIIIFLTLFSITWQNFIVWLPILLPILGNMCLFSSW